MPNNQYDKRLIGLLGEMHLSMKLHQEGWQVYRAYIDEQIDFIIARYYCNTCQDFSALEIRNNPKRRSSFPTNLCQKCKQDKLEFAVRFIQAKASAGTSKKHNSTARKYHFHAKLRSNVDDRSFYVWIAFYDIKRSPHFYVFNHKDIEKFDDLTLASYQETDNQKTTLKINNTGQVLNKGKKHCYACFNNEFKDNFEGLKMVL